MSAALGSVALVHQLLRQLVVEALLTPADSRVLLAQAEAAATTTRDRQLVAIAAAHLRGEGDRVDALAREHLVDHPDDVLVAWIAGAAHDQSHPEEER